MGFSFFLVTNHWFLMSNVTTDSKISLLNQNFYPNHFTYLESLQIRFPADLQENSLLILYFPDP